MPYPSPCYVLLQGGKYITIIGAAGPPTVQTPADAYYDGETYRNQLPASYIGRPWNIITEVDSSDEATVLVGPTPGGNVVEDIVTPVTIEQTQDTIAAKDDVYNATAPISLEKETSRYIWKDASANIVGGCLVSEYIGESAAIPSYVGAVPPIYTPPT